MHQVRTADSLAYLRRENRPYLQRLTFLVALIGGVFTVVNVPTVGGQLGNSPAPWSEVFAALFFAWAAISIVLSGGAWIVLRLSGNPRVRHWAYSTTAAVRLIGAGSNSVLATGAVLLWAITGTPLYRVSESSYYPTPFIELTFLISILFAVLAGMRRIWILIAYQTVMTLALFIQVGNEFFISLSECVYAVIFSFLIAGTCYFLLETLDELSARSDRTINERIQAAALATRLAENSRVNTILHDYIIAVAAVVGRKMQVPRPTLQTSAREALAALDSLTDNPAPAPEDLPAEHNNAHDDAVPATSGGDGADHPSHAHRCPGGLVAPEDMVRALENLGPDDGADSLPRHVAVLDLVNYLQTVAEGEPCEFHARRALNYIRGMNSRVRALSSAVLPVAIITREQARAMIGAIREALRNITLHARAERSWIEVEVSSGHNGQLTVRIGDDGVGFIPENITKTYGLRHSIIERIERVGGQVAIDSRPGAGTVVSLAVPVQVRDRSTLACGVPQERAGQELRSLSSEFHRYLSSWLSRLLFFGSIALIWMYVIGSVRAGIDAPEMATVGAGLTLLYLPLALDPARLPSRAYLVVNCVASAALPAVALLAIPPATHPGLYSFVMPLLVITHLWLSTRGQGAVAIIALGAASTVFGLTSLRVGFALPMPWDVIGRSMATLGGALCYVAVVNRIFSAINAEVDSQGVLSSIRAARLAVIDAQRTRIGRIDQGIRSFLTELASGADPEPLAQHASLTEEWLRDEIRAERLCVSPLSGQVGAARARGVRIRLVDNSSADCDLSALITAACQIVRNAQAGESVVIRALPATASECGTILHTPISGEESLVRIAR